LSAFLTVHIHQITTGLIILGTAIVVYSFFPVAKMIAQSSSGSMRLRYVLLGGFLIFFVAGYVGTLLLLPDEATTQQLIMAFVFLNAALFVHVVFRMMLQTVQDLKRMAALESETITDPLLGTYNRRYLERRLQEEVARAKRYALPLSLLLLDLDHFKQINDGYGHPVGDEVLRNLGRLLLASIRKTDLVARYGGEEVAVLLLNTDEAGAYTFAERLRERIEQSPFTTSPIQNGPIYCTASLGISTIFKDKYDEAELLRRADVALYQAKKQGRNCVVIYRPEQEITNPSVPRDTSISQLTTS
jgi:diguanylate cyclase (GGDEF)-like protein